MKRRSTPQRRARRRGVGVRMKKLPDLPAIFANTADGVWISDQEGVVLFWNRAAEAIQGYLAQQVVGQLCSTVFSGCDRNGNSLRVRETDHHCQSPPLVPRADRRPCPRSPPRRGRDSRESNRRARGSRCGIPQGAPTSRRAETHRSHRSLPGARAPQWSRNPIISGATLLASFLGRRLRGPFS